MNPFIALRAIGIVFKLRKFIALGVLLEFAIRKQMNSSGKKSKKGKSSQTEIQTFLEDNVTKAHGIFNDLKKQYDKRK